MIDGAIRPADEQDGCGDQLRRQERRVNASVRRPGRAGPRDAPASDTRRKNHCRTQRRLIDWTRRSTGFLTDAFLYRSDIAHVLVNTALLTTVDLESSDQQFYTRTYDVANMSTRLMKMIELVCREGPTRHIIGHFGDESFQAINCTGTDNQKQSNTTLHTPETQKRNRENCPS